ncbi:MAG: hypothetical protein ACO1RX_13405 [Candidatus Sericytochromatia bacterium]
MNLVLLARLLMVATLALMAWSLYRGLGMQAVFQFFLGASVVLFLRRWQESRASREPHEKP